MVDPAVGLAIVPFAMLFVGLVFGYIGGFLIGRIVGRGERRV